MSLSFLGAENGLIGRLSVIDTHCSMKVADSDGMEHLEALNFEIDKL